MAVFFSMITAEKGESSILKLRFDFWISFRNEKKELEAAILKSGSEFEYIFTRKFHSVYLVCLFVYLIIQNYGCGTALGNMFK